MNKKHKLIVYNWIAGVLHFVEHEAESVEHACQMLEKLVYFKAKIYDCDDILIDTHHGHGHHDHNHDHY
jgi:hypothetical protein